MLDFEFSFQGVTWNESDVPFCYCVFVVDERWTSSGWVGYLRVDLIEFDSIGPKPRLQMSFNFTDGNFGFSALGYRGTSEDGEAGGSIGLNYFVTPEPDTLALFGLGLAGLGLSRRRLAA